MRFTILGYKARSRINSARFTMGGFGGAMSAAIVPAV